MREAPEDLENRLPVWRALQDFYLDNELTQEDLEYIARVLARSPYAMRDLDHIMFREMWPAFIQNLGVAPGNWVGWKDDFIRERVLGYAQRLRLIPWWLHPVKLLMFGRKWPYVKKRADELRNKPLSREVGTR